MKVLALALNTSREAIRNKVLYSILLFAAVLTAVSAAFGAVSLGDTLRFVKDFSFFSISLFGVITTVVLGVNLLNKELGRRTIFTILSKPVARWEFLVGKFLGLLATVVTMLALMAAALVGLLFALEGQVDWLVLPVVGAMMLELTVLSATAIFFSSIVVTPALAGLFTAATFIAGRSAGQLAYFVGPDHPVALRGLARVLSAALPHLDRLYVADRLSQGQALPAAFYVNATLYAAAYAAVLLLLSVMIFRRREFV